MSDDPLPVLTDLTPPELELLDSTRRGVVAQVSELPVHLLAVSDVSGHLVRGRFLRELLLGRHGELDPRGVRLTGARITGDLDLAHVRAKCGLYLTRCTIEGSFSAADARIENLTCEDSRFDHLDAGRLRVEGVLGLAGTRITEADSDEPPINLGDAHVGELDCSGLEIRTGSIAALFGDGLHVDGDVTLWRARIHCFAEYGALRLTSARIGGQLDGAELQVVNDAGPAVQADGLQVGNNLYMMNAHITGAGQLGALRLLRTEIGGQAQFAELQVSNPSGPAITADNLRVASTLYLGKARIAGNGPDGALRLPGAQIGGQLSGDELDVHNFAGPAIIADGIGATSQLSLRDARLTGSGELGALRLPGGNIRGQFSAADARIINETGPGIVADGLKVEGDLYLNRVHVTGAGPSGAVRMVSTRIGSQLTCTDMRVVNRSGPGVTADRLDVTGNLSFKNVRITGNSGRGALRLPSAKIRGQLNLTAHSIRNPHGSAINLIGTRTDGVIFLPCRLVCVQAWGRSCRWSTKVDLDDFTFGSLASLSWREWLHLIRFHTPRYTPSPYQKLAASERAAGHDGNARHVLITQQQDLQRRDSRALGGRLTHLFHRSWGLLAGYGYRARRTAAALLIALIAAATVGLVAGHITDGTHHAAERVTSFAQPAGQPCSTVELIGVGLDRGLPLSPTGVRTRCDLNTETTAGEWFTLLIWLIQAAVWGLATLALAGYTGLIRKPA
ncbi:hypothetical protein [Amycolatopsis sp. cmx-4-83]|uniref:hypothetical protein n=1 Tax=Amycolatopsis sp. cmx-4-83 TaxID=2790940 RepID=UPI00397A16B7